MYDCGCASVIGRVQRVIGSLKPGSHVIATIAENMKSSDCNDLFISAILAIVRVTYGSRDRRHITSQVIVRQYHDMTPLSKATWGEVKNHSVQTWAFYA